MNKQELFLDIDDVLFDTENHLRRKLGGEWSSYNGLLYEAYKDMSFDELAIILGVFSNYKRIPFIKGARRGLEKLREKYNVILCSSFCFDVERKAKVEVAEILGLPLILCGGESWYKDGIDMSSGIIVDDNTRIVNLSNASKKVHYYKYGNMVEVLDKSKGVTVFDWSELLNMLL